MKLITMNSPNHYNGRFGWKADTIVFHQTGGDTLKPALNWYMNPNAQCSPNWVIDKDGTVYQLVHPDNAAQCNGTQTSNPSAKLYYGKATSKLVKSRKTNANYYTYSMEFVHCQWGNINDAQIKACVELINTVIIPHMLKNGVKTVYIDREHVIGHCEIDPIGREFCPGKKFPYAKVISMIKETYGKTEPPKENKKDTFEVGDRVTINSSAKCYADSMIEIPVKYKGDVNVYTIFKVTNDKALLKELYSWVSFIDLNKK